MAVGDVLRLFVIVAGVYMVPESNSVTCEEKDDRTLLSCMGGFVCIDDSFRCHF